MTNITLLGIGSVSAAAAADFGYFAGGFTGVNVTTNDKLDFAADTTTMVTVVGFICNSKRIYSTVKR